MPDRHALLGPSKAHQWLSCPPSIRLEEFLGLPDKGSIYAREGTLAHRLGELLLRRDWEGADVTRALEEARRDPDWSPAMEEHMAGYADFVAQRMAQARNRCADPRLFIEQELHFEDYVPGGFGTSDALLLSDGLLEVIDLKYGAGVPVRAGDNPQMKLYALGGYLALGWAYDVPEIRMTIYQPRLDSVSSDTITRSALLDWAEGELKPRAAQAWAGEGDYHPSEETCRWCRAAPVCRARADYQQELAAYDFADPPTLSNEEIAQVLARLPDLLGWARQVEAWALDAALNLGAVFPGFKVVEGRSNRRYTDEAAIAGALTGAGYTADDIYKPRELLGLTAMEKKIGRKRLTQLAGQYIIKPAGAPTLVPEGDRRPAYTPAAQAANDFMEE
ncbi:MAG: DUF2800 domain-containing protein [Candidatus Onthomonas sp.]